MSNKQALVATIVVERNSICLQIYRMIIAYLRAYRHTGRRSSSSYISYNSHVLCVCIEHNAKCCVIARAHKTRFFPSLLCRISSINRTILQYLLANAAEITVEKNILLTQN